jgi:hypothetical protein
MIPGETPATPAPAPDRFRDALTRLVGQKVRFYVGGGEKGYLQGPVAKVDGNYIYIEKEGPIRGTIQTITINADFVHYYEIDRLQR